MVRVVAALIWRGDEFFICRRPAGKARALLWEFAGGKVEPGETPEQTLVRECMEELGAKVSVKEQFAQVIHEYPDVTIELTLFDAVFDGCEPQMHEHSGFAWITASEIGNYEFCPADLEILDAIAKKDSLFRAQCETLGTLLSAGAISAAQYKTSLCTLACKMGMSGRVTRDELSSEVQQILN